MNFLKINDTFDIINKIKQTLEKKVENNVISDAELKKILDLLNNDRKLRNALNFL